MWVQGPHGRRRVCRAELAEGVSGMGKPLFFLVDDDAARLEALAGELRRRFGADYQVLAERSPSAALATLVRLGAGDEVAMLVAPTTTAEMDGTELLVRAHELHPSAKRVLLVGRGEWASAHPLARAMTLGQVDHYLFGPWGEPERWLFLPVSQILADWTAGRATTFEAVRIVGERWAERSHELRDLFSRIALPHGFYEPGSETGKALLDQAGGAAASLPLLVFRSGRVLTDPSNAEIAEVLGFRSHADGRTYDVAVVGGGPAGLAAAVYAASEGLRTLIVEPTIFGGQAGTSSLIRNYLGFPHGISGDDLANRAMEQVWLFGAEFVLAQRATSLTVTGGERVIGLSDGDEVSARTVIIAKWAATVTILVRGDGLAATMSDYLVREIDALPNVTVRPHTEAVGGQGRGRLEALTLRDNTDGTTQTVPATALFVMIGAEPRTEWLDGVVERDPRGYLLTGHDLLRDGRPPAAWPLARPPLLFETSVPGVFAAGDVRHRSVKRVASAVGAGAIVVQLVHEYLAEQHT